MATGTWSNLADAARAHRHIVHLHRDRVSLEAAVAAWILPALSRSGGALLVGSPDHVAGVRARLTHQGLDATLLEASGRLVVLDAEGFLARFVVDGAVDPVRFRRLLDEVLRSLRASVGTGEVRAWGEMVDLLRLRGDLGGALALEEAWNAALAGDGFRLLCSYGLDNLDPATHEGVLADVGSAHGFLAPEPDEARFEEAVERAFAEVAGAEADALRARASAAPPAVATTPPQALLLGLHATEPAVGRRVLEATRARLGA